MVGSTLRICVGNMELFQVQNESEEENESQSFVGLLNLTQVIWFKPWFHIICCIFEYLGLDGG